MASTPDPDAPLPFGISAETGRPLNPLGDDAIDAMLRKETEPKVEAALAGRADAAAVAFALEGGIDANDLSQAGWGIIYGPSVGSKIKDALSPLIEHRSAQARPFRVFEGSIGYVPGDTADQWLARHQVRMDVVNPEDGVPFYLLIVASPDEIPFEFQYNLDIYWAAGRLWFDSAAQFRQYADSVIDYETAAAVPTQRLAAMFATEHDFDAATQLFMRQVAVPLADQRAATTSVWARQKFALRTLLGDAATKDGFAAVLRGVEHGRPALLFSGSHGMEFKAEDPRQRACQGALVCQDWGGFGNIKEEHWFAGSDVPAGAHVHGIMHFLFACHGGGCPELDNYDRVNNSPRRIASAPFLSQLPQKMLSHPDGGALAVLAHIERAWAYSFQGPRGGPQVQGFRDVLGRLLHGERIGQATDVFNLRWAALSVSLSELHADLRRGIDVPLRRLGNLWIARDDARNFMILGDPAVRLRVEDMPSV